MKILTNLLLFTVFVFLVSASVLFPLSLVKTRLPNSGLSVLGSSTGPNSLEVSFEDGAAGRTILATGLVYPGQNTYYNNAFRLTNQTGQPQSYKLMVLKIYPLGRRLTVELDAGAGGQNVILSPNSSVSVNVRITSPEADNPDPYKFTAKILTLNLN